MIDNYTKDELEDIIKNSNSMREVISKLGYKTHNGSNNKTVKKRIEKYNISTKHFQFVKPTNRTYENVFCINSTATQATLRRWFCKISDDSKCSICGQTKEWNGKPLTMTLDHINGHNHDNRIENLRWLCPNCASQLPTFAGRNNRPHDGYVPVKIVKKQKKICPVCNINKINKQSHMCRECYLKKISVNIPLKEELEKLIYKYSFTQIGKIYGVSDNSVRKWCKKYDLPYRYGELHKYNN